MIWGEHLSTRFALGSPEQRVSSEPLFSFASRQTEHSRGQMLSGNWVLQAFFSAHFGSFLIPWKLSSNFSALVLVPCPWLNCSWILTLISTFLVTESWHDLVLLFSQKAFPVPPQASLSHLSAFWISLVFLCFNSLMVANSLKLVSADVALRPLCLASYTLLLALAVRCLSCSQQLHQIIVQCWNRGAYICKSYISLWLWQITY